MKYARMYRPTIYATGRREGLHDLRTICVQEGRSGKYEGTSAHVYATHQLDKEFLL